MAWFDNLFSGLDSGSSAASVDPFGGWDAAVGHAAAGAPSFDFGSMPDDGLEMGGDWGFGGFGDAGSQMNFGGFGGAGLDQANPASFASPNVPSFDPNMGGSPPSLGAADSVGTAAPGVFAAGPGGGDVFGGSMDPEQLARKGTLPGESGGSRVGSTVQQPPPPTAWESAKQAPGKWWEGASNEFNRAPIGTSMRVGTGLASIGLPLLAAGLAPSARRSGPGPESRAGDGYPTVPPVPPAPLPGTTGIGRADIPAGSPMSPLMGGPGGGFQVKPNVGLSPQKLALGGVVGATDYGLGLKDGGKVESGYAQGGKVDSRTQAEKDQDERDYQEAMGRKPGARPVQPAQTDQQLKDAEAGKQVRPGSYLRRGYADGGRVQMTPEQQVEQALQLQLRKFIPTLQSPPSIAYDQNDPSSIREMPTINLHPVNQGSRMPMVQPNDLMRRSRERGPGGPA